MITGAVMKLKPREFQTNIINNTRKSLRTNRNVLIQAPTGAGKTVIATIISDSVVKKGNLLYFICHRQELIEQTAKTFAKNGIAFSFIASGYSYNPQCKVQICSIDTLKNRYERLPKPSVAIWDECHHLGAAGWSKVHGFYDTTYHIGLSATPQRLDGKGLGKWFDDMIIETSVAKLIKAGYLSDYKIFSSPVKPDLTGIKKSMGDYNKKELGVMMDNATLMGDIVSHWKKHALGLKTICFAVNIDHSRHIVKMFNDAGIPAAHLDGGSTRKERRQICMDFATGKIQVLSNVGLFGEGFDLAAQTDIDVTIECLISARPTLSLSLWLQMCGRALRMKDYAAIILDHAGNAMKHGLPCQDREWSLEGDPNQGKKKGETEVPIKECPECYAVHAPSPTCPNCGHVYEVKEREIKHVEGELQELSKEQMRVAARKEQGGAGSITELIALGQRRGYKNPAKWAAHVWTSRQAKANQRQYS